MAKANTADISQSEHIRRYIAKHPADGPKAIVAGLHEQGIEVSYAVAAYVRHMSKNGKRSTGRTRRAGRSARHVAARNGSAERWSLDELVAAKKMAEQLGGVEAASRALAALAKLS